MPFFSRRYGLGRIVAFISIASGIFSLILVAAWLSASISNSFNTVIEVEASDRGEVFKARVGSEIDKFASGLWNIVQDRAFRQAVADGNEAASLSFLFSQYQESSNDAFSLVYANRGDEIGWIQTSNPGVGSAIQDTLVQIEKNPPDSLVSIRALGAEGAEQLYLVFSTSIVDPESLLPVGVIRAVAPLAPPAELIIDAMADSRVDCIVLYFGERLFNRFGLPQCIDGALDFKEDVSKNTFRTVGDDRELEFTYGASEIAASFLTDHILVVLGKETKTLSMFRGQLFSFGLSFLIAAAGVALITVGLTRRILRRDLGALLTYVDSSADEVNTNKPYLLVEEFEHIANVFTSARSRLVEKERERQRADQDIADLNRQLNHAHAQKMESLGVLTSGVAHDFNNIIAVITTALDQLGAPDAQERDLQIARHATNRATLIVRKLLTFARQDQRHVCEIDHEAEVSDLISILGPAFGPTYRFSYETRTKKWLKADPDLFSATVMNLAINARDAMAGGGDIEIAARDATPDEQARTGSDPSVPMVAITITDSGEGIAPDLAERVFEPFFSTKPVGKGTGLGLSMAIGFAKGAGGAIFFDTRYEGGARLVLVLPATDQPVVTQPTQISVENASLEGMRILVADDEDALGMMIERYLVSRGAIVSRATNVTVALDVLEENPAFDVILVDLNMPDGSGNEIIKAAGAGANKDAIFLLISGNFDVAKATRSEDGPTIYQIPKPFRLTELSKIIITIFDNPTNAGDILRQMFR